MELAVESLDGLGNPQRLLFEIDVLPSQSAHLAPTEAEHQHRGPRHVIAFILDGDEQVSSLLDRQRFLDYRPWRFDPHELDDVAGARAAFPLRKAGGVLAIAGAPATKGDHWTAWRANDVREMRINPDGLHPTPVEEHSKVVRTRTALLALQARAAAAPAPASAR